MSVLSFCFAPPSAPSRPVAWPNFSVNGGLNLEALVIDLSLRLLLPLLPPASTLPGPPSLPPSQYPCPLWRLLRDIPKLNLPGFFHWFRKRSRSTLNILHPPTRPPRPPLLPSTTPSPQKKDVPTQRLKSIQFLSWHRREGHEWTWTIEGPTTRLTFISFSYTFPFHPNHYPLRPYFNCYIRLAIHSDRAISDALRDPWFFAHFWTPFLPLFIHVVIVLHLPPFEHLLPATSKTSPPTPKLKPHQFLRHTKVHTHVGLHATYKYAVVHKSDVLRDECDLNDRQVLLEKKRFGK